jgi:hypothetical protein
MDKLNALIAQQAAALDERWKREAHVTAEQIDAGCASAARWCTSNAQQALSDDLAEAIKSKLKSKPKAPKASEVAA